MAQNKKEYQKPVLEKLVLIPRENVLAACHGITGSGDYFNTSCFLADLGGCYGPTLLGPSVP